VWIVQDGRGVVTVDTKTPWRQPGLDYKAHISTIVISSYGQSLNNNKPLQTFIDMQATFQLIDHAAMED
jgi:hypothetical protein